MLRTLCFLLLLLVAAHATAEGLMPVKGEQIETSVTVETADGEVEVPLLLYVPRHYASESTNIACPLVLFLHGYGESGHGGEELSRVKKHGPPKQVAEGKVFEFILASPQCPPPAEHDKDLIAAAWQAEVLLALLEKLEQQLEVDRNRVYLTGLSMGGYGAWRLAAAAPDRFAAVVPICGGGKPESVNERLEGLQVWAFHGERDDVVPLSESTEMAEAFRRAGAKVRLTSYSEAGHDSWTQTYDNPMFYDWLLTERLDQRSSDGP